MDFSLQRHEDGRWMLIGDGLPRLALAPEVEWWLELDRMESLSGIQDKALEVAITAIDAARDRIAELETLNARLRLDVDRLTEENGRQKRVAVENELIKNWLAKEW